MPWYFLYVYIFHFSRQDFPGCGLGHSQIPSVDQAAFKLTYKDQIASDSQCFDSRPAALLPSDTKFIDMGAKGKQCLLLDNSSGCAIMDNLLVLLNKALIQEQLL